MPDDPEARPGARPERPQRRLGVVEAFVAVRDQCPSGPARAVAETALETIRSRRPGVVAEQAFLVFTATRGWRGDRADQVRDSLRAFLDDPAHGREPG